MSGSLRQAQTTARVTRSSGAPVEQGPLACAARQDPYSLLRRAAAERAAELAYESGVVRELDLEAQVGCAQASSFRAVREDQAEASRRTVCGP
jgi:hypothetical protein